MPQLLPRRDVLAPDNTTAQNRFWSASISEQFRLVAAALYEYGTIPVVGIKLALIKWGEWSPLLRVNFKGSRQKDEIQVHT